MLVEPLHTTSDEKNYQILKVSKPRVEQSIMEIAVSFDLGKGERIGITVTTRIGREDVSIETIVGSEHVEGEMELNGVSTVEQKRSH